MWQVLKALRAHDERLDAAINSMELNGQGPENIIVEQVSLEKAKKQDDPLGGSAPDGDEAGAGLCVPALASWISLGQPARFGVIPMRIVSGWG